MCPDEPHIAKMTSEQRQKRLATLNSLRAEHQQAFARARALKAQVEEAYTHLQRLEDMIDCEEGPPECSHEERYPEKRKAAERSLGAFLQKHGATQRTWDSLSDGSHENKHGYRYGPGERPAFD